MDPVCALTIAGSDSGGGAGIQADLKTMAALGVFGTSAITAVTAQNTTSVTAVEVLTTKMVLAQIEAVLDDFSIAGIKTGMLGSVATVTAIASLIDDGTLAQVVVDPVFITSTGHSLIGPGGIEAYRDILAPRAAILTPNLDETAALLGCSVHELNSEAALIDAASQLRDLGATMVVVKGGHLDAEHAKTVVDVIASPLGTEVLRHNRITTANTHGTGCTFAAAIASGLACEMTEPEAIAAAATYVHGGLLGAKGWRLGHGSGPLDHFGWTSHGAREQDQ